MIKCLHQRSIFTFKTETINSTICRMVGHSYIARASNGDQTPEHTCVTERFLTQHSEVKRK